MTTRGPVGVWVMGDYKQWRRKFGVLTLGVACVFMVGWMRSQSRYEGVHLHSGKHALGVESDLDAIDFNVTIRLDETIYSQSFSAWSGPTNSNPDDPFDGTPWGENHDISWRADWLGFHVGIANVVYSGQAVRRDYDCMIPYWSLVLPLTALSAWLLFSKQNQPRAIG